MTERVPSLPNLIRSINRLADRVYNLERRPFPHTPAVEVFDVEKLPAYSWQSPVTLTVMTGHRLYADRNGTIVFCRAERSSADGTSTATLDVLKNGSSIFTSATKPMVEAATGLGEERIPDEQHFLKGDHFAVEIEATGGGTGPLRMTIKFITDE